MSAMALAVFIMPLLLPSARAATLTPFSHFASFGAPPPPPAPSPPPEPAPPPPAALPAPLGGKQACNDLTNVAPVAGGCGPVAGGLSAASVQESSLPPPRAPAGARLLPDKKVHRGATLSMDDAQRAYVHVHKWMSPEL